MTSTDVSPHCSPVPLRVVHALRLRGFADLATIVEVVQQLGGSRAEPVMPGQIVPLLDDLVAEGEARMRDGRMTGWLLTQAGRQYGQNLLATELDDIGGRAQVETVYQRFLSLNGDFLETCTQWQVRSSPDGAKIPNDHSDARYDDLIISRIERFNDQVQPLCGELASLLCRFERYGPRFDHALAQVRSGNTDWMAKPSIDSYHSVWFELHEDLLASLSIERQNEH